MGDLFERLGARTWRVLSGANKEFGLGLSVVPGAVDSEDPSMAAVVAVEEGGPLDSSLRADEETSSAKASG